MGLLRRAILASLLSRGGEEAALRRAGSRIEQMLTDRGVEVDHFCLYQKPTFLLQPPGSPPADPVVRRRMSENVSKSHITINVSPIDMRHGF
jgi:hypothetical protein